jgi:hypothetical protein
MTTARFEPSALKAWLVLACAMVAIAPRVTMAADDRPETHVYWGDVHLHTNYSWDAYGTGNTSVTPDQAYRFARGLPVVHPALHTTVQIRRPLDFLAVTDHAIMLGSQAMLDQRDPALLATDWGKKLLAIHEKSPVAGVMREGGRLGVMGGPEGTPERKEMMDQVFSPAIRQRAWDTEIEAAEKNNVPGTFTTLIGWEWTSTPGGKNLHRCVITDADGAKARQFIPFSNYQSQRPEDLWRFFAETKERTGVDFISIPHNSNLSGGLMFDVVDSDGRPFTADYARMRMRWETEVEIAWSLSAAGRAAVWATENTRQAIFDAFKRKEVYGTTGTRIVLRVFGGFDFRPADAAAKDIAAVGYRKGVPMGGELANAPQRAAPGFLIYAAKDPLSGNLDRVQVIKGWVDGTGETHEKIFDVAWSGDRKIGADGKLPPVGNTVDESTAQYTNTIGVAELATVWKDPSFDPKQLAFYYVRVLEIPTPRHSLYEAVALGIAASETHQPASIQERAYSSPIWYTP